MEDALLLTQIVNCTKKSMYMTVQKNCFHVKNKKLKLLIPYCCVEKREIICYLDCLTIFVTRLLIKGINKRCKSIFWVHLPLIPNLYTSVLAFSKLCKFGTFHRICYFSQRKSKIGTKS